MGRVHYPPLAGGATRAKRPGEAPLTKLAVLAAAPVVARHRHVAPVRHFLADDAQAHARQRHTARLGNLRAAFRAMLEAGPGREIAAGALDGVLHARLDLLLYRAFMCPTRGHGSLRRCHELSYIGRRASIGQRGLPDCYVSQLRTSAAPEGPAGNGSWPAAGGVRRGRLGRARVPRLSELRGAG